MAFVVKTAIPYSGFPVQDKLEYIQHLAREVVQHGPDYEAAMRDSSEADSPYSFLHDTSSHAFGYYKWVLFCLQRGIVLSKLRDIEKEHLVKLNSCKPGYLDLCDTDQQTLLRLLAQNKGTKPQISQLRTWILERSHSAYVIAAWIRKYVTETLCSGQLSGEERYNQLLFTIYVLNDVLSNGKTANFKGHYTSILEHDVMMDISSIIFPHLPVVMKTCHVAATTDSQRDKIIKLAKLWEVKGFLDSQRSSVLNMTLLQSHMPPDPPAEAVITPYIDLRVIAEFTKPVPPMHNPHFVSNPAVQNILPPAPPLFAPPPPPPPKPPAPSLSLPSYQVEPSAHNASLLVPSSSGLRPLDQTIDLLRIPVGNMANIAKAFNKAGAPRYAPLDLSGLTRAINPHVEPGRLEARIADFIRKYDDIKSSKSYNHSHNQQERKNREQRRGRNESSDEDDRDRKSARRRFD